jgi:hypothetical protein
LSIALQCGYDAGFEDDFASVLAALGIVYLPSWRPSRAAAGVAGEALAERVRLELKVLRSRLSSLEHILVADVKAIAAAGRKKAMKGLLIDCLYITNNSPLIPCP